MAKEKNFEWYVVNYDTNKNEVIHFNIFQNNTVLERTRELCKAYKRERMTFEEFTEKLRMIIMCEEWARCEYEVMVGSLFDENPKNYQKIDCYWQVLPNIKIVAKYVHDNYFDGENSN